LQYLNKRFSVSGPQTTAGACEACVYGRGKHEVWCDEAPNDPTVGSPANDADLDLLRAEVGATAEPAVPGAGAGAGAQVPKVRLPMAINPIFSAWHEQHDTIAEGKPLLGEVLWPKVPDYVPAVGGCSCGGKNG
jgi:hypothetical protein